MNQQAPIPINELLLHTAKKFQEIAPQIQTALHGTQKTFTKFLKQNPEFFEQLHHFLKKLHHLPEQQRETWITTAERD